MNNAYYSVIGLLAGLIHLIINANAFYAADGRTHTRETDCRRYLMSVFAYYITDASWGFIAATGNTALLYADTVLYYIAMASSVVFWCRYVVSYLKLEGLSARALNLFGIGFWCAEFVLLGVNHFKPVFFRFDAEGNFQALFFRYAALAVQVVMFAWISFVSLNAARRSAGAKKRRNLTICVYGFLMAVTVVAQILYPLLPLYSMGLMLGTIVLHVFVEEDEKEEYRRELSAALREAEVAAGQLQTALEAAKEAGEAKTRFLFNMSHDIRTPMNAIIGFTQLLKKHIDDREAVLDYLGKIESSNEFLLSLINNVLEMARIESGKELLDEVPENLGTFTDSVVSLFEPRFLEKGITFTVQSEILHEDVLVDTTKLREIWLNIIGNALKYTPSGGTVRLSLQELPAEAEGAAVYRTTVEDTGIGMSRDFLPHLFEEFTRERTSTASGVIGTGLGMPIVKKLVDLMHGDIRVESTLGKGTKFTITLTHRLVPKEETATKGAENTWEEIDFSGKRVLLAEDNDLNAEIAMSILGDDGFLTERAEDGVVCLSMLEQAPAGYYDVVLMDVQMPNMDGYKATQLIRRLPDPEKADIPIIAMTANAFEEDRKNAFRMGMNAHLAKPIQIDLMKRTLGHMLLHTEFDTRSYALWRERFRDCAPLIEFEEKYEKLGLPCGCFIYEAVGREKMLYADDAAVSIFGCASYEEFRAFVGDSFKTMVHSEDILRVEAEIETQFRASSDGIDKVRYRITRKDGSVRRIDDIGRKVYTENGLPAFFVLVADITGL
ncbi:MAG: ATP-binding protein [Clostridia bacterium]|nr:ATP-binding protein [Clostridia bacterium]